MNYLYNGIELPDINTVWTDKETYPYALIQWDAEYGYYYLKVFTKEVHYRLSASGDYEIMLHFDAVPFVHHRAGENWYDKRVYNTTDGFISTSGWSKNLYSVVWSNYDVLNADGSVYLKASDPIPVGGTSEPIDPTSMLMGWLVGRAAASQRGKA